MSCSDVEIPLGEPSAKYKVQLSNSGRRMVIRKVLVEPKHRTKTSKRDGYKEERKNKKKKKKVEEKFRKKECTTNLMVKTDDGSFSSDSEDDIFKKKSSRKSEDKLNAKSITEILYDSDSTSNEEKGSDNDVSDSSLCSESKGTDATNAGTPKKSSEKRDKWLRSIQNEDFSKLSASEKSEKSSQKNSKKNVIEKGTHSRTQKTEESSITKRGMSPRKDHSKTEVSKKENSNIPPPELSVVGTRTSQRQRKQKYDSSNWELSPVKVTPMSERRRKNQKRLIESDSSQDSSDDENSSKHKFVKVVKSTSSIKEVCIKVERVDSLIHSSRTNITSMKNIIDNTKIVESCDRKSIWHSPRKTPNKHNVVASEEHKSPVRKLKSVLDQKINDNIKVESCVDKSTRQSPRKTPNKHNVVASEEHKSPVRKLKSVLDQKINDNIKVESCVDKSTWHSPRKIPNKHNVVASEEHKSPVRKLKSVLDEKSNDNLKKVEPSTKMSMEESACKTPRKHNVMVSEEQCTSPANKLKQSLQKSPIMLRKETQNEHTPQRKVTTPFVLRAAGKLLTPTTPSSTRGRHKRQVCTPSMPSCKRTFDTPQTPLQEAMSRLHVAAVPQSLPCREAEFENIQRFLEGKILDGAGGSIYISGVPGTGKTATVREVVRSLKRDVESDDLPEFKFIEINGMRLSHPRQAYVQIWKAISGEVVTAEQAQRLLENRFTKNTKKEKETTVLLVDEVDVLWTRRQDVVYNLLDWPSKAQSHLVVVTIANTMDLPERLLMGRVTSRLGLTRLTFQPYTHKQLEDIVRARLKGINAFDSDAVQFVSRKVASVSGDARRALDICRRATEIAEEESPEALVTIKHIDEAMLAMTSSNTVLAIMQACSTMEKMFLQSVEAELTRTGLEETTFRKAYKMMETLCTLEGMEIPSVTVMLRVCMNLSSIRLLLCQDLQKDVYTRIFLNVSADDLHYALKCIKTNESGRC